MIPMTRNEIQEAAETVEIVLAYVPPGQRAKVLAKVAEQMEPKAAVDIDVIPDAAGRPLFKFQSRIILGLVRGITNYHSPKDADKILFQQHCGPGSGRLLDYIKGLPSLR